MFHNAANIAELFTFNSCQNLINNQTKFNIEPVNISLTQIFVAIKNLRHLSVYIGNPNLERGKL